MGGTPPLETLASRLRRLKPQQKEMVKNIAHGKSIAELAKEAGISPAGMNLRLVAIYTRLELPATEKRGERRNLLVRAWQLIEEADTNASANGDAGAAAVMNGIPATPASGTAAPTAEAPRQHEPLPLAAGNAHVASTSVALHDSRNIAGITTLSSNRRDFDDACARLIAQGYAPEVLNEYQSLAHPEMSCVSVIFVKRRR